MQLRDHDGVESKRDFFTFNPRLLKIDAGYNVRDLDAADERPDLDELKESIRTNGVRVPLEVRLLNEDVFVVAGHRRHKAVMELIAEGEDIKLIPVIPEPKYTNDGDRILNLVVSNSGKPLKALEVAEVVRRLTAFGWDAAQIAKRMGWKSTNTVTQHLEMVALPEPVKQHVRANEISATLARNLAKSELTPEEQDKLIKDNLDQNRRIRGTGKGSTKVTQRTLKRDAKPKPDKLQVPSQKLNRAERETEEREPASNSVAPEPVLPAAPDASAPQHVDALDILRKIEREASKALDEGNTIQLQVALKYCRDVARDTLKISVEA